MKTHHSYRVLRGLSRATHVAGLVAATVLLVIGQSSTRTRALLDSRSITVSTARAGAVSVHSYAYTQPVADTIGSVKFEYCSNSPIIDDSCTAPTGLDVSATTLNSYTGDAGYSIHPMTTSSSNVIVVTRAAAVSVVGVKRFVFGSITNPSTTGSVYVRISTYATTNASGAYNDWSSVVYSITQSLSVNVYVPPFLLMCHAATVAVDCSSVGTSLVDLGEISKVSATTGTTQFSVATNSENGFSASIYGSTMTAGNRTIQPLSTRSISLNGSSQFGINLVANSTPAVGESPLGAGTATPSTDYGVPDQFKFVSGETIASSPISTEWKRFTISYLVNIPDGQAAGRYASTISVIAATTF